MHKVPTIVRMAAAIMAAVAAIVLVEVSTASAQVRILLHPCVSRIQDMIMANRRTIVRG